MMNERENKPVNNVSPQYYINNSLKRTALERIAKRDSTHSETTKSMRLEKILSGLSAAAASALAASAVLQNTPQMYGVGELIASGYLFALSTVFGAKYLKDRDRARELY